jgi:hypothetical protein
VCNPLMSKQFIRQLQLLHKSFQAKVNKDSTLLKVEVRF